MLHSNAKSIFFIRHLFGSWLGRFKRWESDWFVTTWVTWILFPPFPPTIEINPVEHFTMDMCPSTWIFLRLWVQMVFCAPVGSVGKSSRTGTYFKLPLITVFLRFTFSRQSLSDRSFFFLSGCAQRISKKPLVSRGGRGGGKGFNLLRLRPIQASFSPVSALSTSWLDKKHP